eukprot:jgi/Bigna1/79648/fgenesh1_pg.64_\
MDSKTATMNPRLDSLRNRAKSEVLPVFSSCLPPLSRDANALGNFPSTPLQGLTHLWNRRRDTSTRLERMAVTLTRVVNARWKATPYAKGGGAASEVPSTMKALVIEDYSMDLSKIALKTVEVPKPKGDEVLVKVLAAAINPIDRAVMRGFLKDSYIIPKFPSLTGFDMAAVVGASIYRPTIILEAKPVLIRMASKATVYPVYLYPIQCNTAKRIEVIETGVDEKRLKVGDTVWAALPTPKRGEPLIMGAFAEYAVLPGSKCGVSPSNLSPVEIAALPVAVLTSGQALEQCRLEKGQRLLVLGGSSSTGSAAIQLAKAKGFHVTTTCSSRNIEYVKSLDADRVIDYTKTHWPDVVEDLDAVTSIVYDCVGEKGVCSHANKVLRKGGRFVSIAAFEEFWDHRWNKDVAAQILTMDPTKRACLDAARDLVEAGKLKVRIAKVHPLEKIAAAVREEGGSAAGGKVVINMM